MSWGRPRKGEAVSERVDIRMRSDLKKSLDKIRKGGRTAFVERAVEPLLKTLDPGKPCEAVCRISDEVTKAKNEAKWAVEKGSLDDALGYLSVARAVEEILVPYRDLCECSRVARLKRSVRR